MADIAPKLLHLSAEKLTALHERIHKSEISPASLEVHHTILNEMARRKMERPKDDWDTYEILVDSIDDVEIASLSETLPADMVANMVAKIDSPVGNLRTYLTVHGYVMRVEGRELTPLEKMLRNEGGKWVVYTKQVHASLVLIAQRKKPKSGSLRFTHLPKPHIRLQRALEMRLAERWNGLLKVRLVEALQP